MALLGNAALAMWWNMADDLKSQFEDWHSHEHFPERLGVPGFLRSSRWTADDGPGVFVLYELEDHAVLSSPAYLARLNDPTPWSRALMPHHRDMVRTQCHVVASHGGVAGRCALTVRVRVRDAHGAARLVESLRGALGDAARRPGVIGAHLLRHAPPVLAQTTEQRIRGAPDGSADLVVLVTAYDPASLDAIAVERLGAASLRALGASDDPAAGRYSLSHSALPSDTA